MPVTKELDMKMQRAAKLRWLGKSWDDIAKRLGYKDEDSAYQAITRKYPDLWRKYIDAAEEEVAIKAAAESNQIQEILKRGMRPKFDKFGRQQHEVDPETGEQMALYEDIPPQTQQSAAHSLLANRAKMRKMMIEHHHKGSIGLNVSFLEHVPKEELEDVLRICEEKTEGEVGNDHGTDDGENEGEGLDGDT